MNATVLIALMGGMGGIFVTGWRKTNLVTRNFSPKEIDNGKGRRDKRLTCLYWLTGLLVLYSFQTTEKLYFTTQLVHRPQCYCLSRHVLTVANFATRGIISCMFRVSPLWLVSTFNLALGIPRSFRRIQLLSIKRMEVQSKSQGEIKWTKAP